MKQLNSTVRPSFLSDLKLDNIVIKPDETVAKFEVNLDGDKAYLTGLHSSFSLKLTPLVSVPKDQVSSPSLLGNPNHHHYCFRDHFLFPLLAHPFSVLRRRDSGSFLHSPFTWFQSSNELNWNCSRGHQSSSHSWTLDLPMCSVSTLSYLSQSSLESLWVLVNVNQMIAFHQDRIAKY